MTRVKVYRISTILSKFFIGFGIIILLLGIISLMKSINTQFNTEFPSGDWNAVLNVIQGIIFITLGWLNLSKNKYFIGWNDNQLRFFLPDTKQPETINFDDIDFINIKLFEIELHFKDEKRTLDLNTLKDEDLKKVKSKFEPLQKAIN